MWMLGDLLKQKKSDFLGVIHIGVIELLVYYQHPQKIIWLRTKENLQTVLDLQYPSTRYSNSNSGN